MKTIVGVSGGVDSAVAALLLREQGHDLEALFMANWDEDDAYCSQAQDFQDARAVCKELGIVLHRVSFAEEYRRQVFDDFLAAHRAGRTPNPDVLCNREIKFGVALAHARRLGATHLATGHYARRVDGVDGPGLYKAIDRAKDQSYFLHAIDREQLSAALFPLGGLTKSEVRAKARAAGLPVHDKKDSTGICFIGERPFREFLAQWLPDAPGPVVDEQGIELGRHRGLAFHTLGQRAGLSIGGLQGRAEAPWYVARKDAGRNALVVVQGQDHPLLMSQTLVTGRAHWLAPPSTDRFRCAAKIRYRQTDQPCEVGVRDDGGLELRFDAPQRAATPGQFAVLYDGERCLGGAAIESI
ncbi:MAG: tRNA 2-thiouridine(34) synthase MnmA [Gammaproteobacteria bacterium]